MQLYKAKRDGTAVILKETETRQDIDELRAVALEQKVYHNEKWRFYSMMNDLPETIEKMSGLFINDNLIGLAIISDYIKYWLLKYPNTDKTPERIRQMGFLDYNIGVYIKPEYRRNGFAADMCQLLMTSFNQDVFASTSLIGDNFTEDENKAQQLFWLSIDHPKLQFFLAPCEVNVYKKIMLHDE